MVESDQEGLEVEEVAGGVESESSSWPGEGMGGSLLTEALRCTFLRGDFLESWRDGMLKLKLGAGSEFPSYDLLTTGPGLSTETGRFLRAVARSAAEHKMPASSAETLARLRVGTELLRLREYCGRLYGLDGMVVIGAQSKCCVYR